VVHTPKGDEDRYTYEELMATCGNIAADVATQGTIIKQQGEVIAQQKELLAKQGLEVEKLQKVVFHQFTEIQALKKTVGKLMQEHMQRQFVMHMRPPTHVATTKGENIRANVEGEFTKEAVETEAAEQAQLSQKEKEAVEALARSTAVHTAVHTKPSTPKAKAKGVVIQERAESRPVTVTPEVSRKKGKSQ
jgi:hypothetical protein